MSTPNETPNVSENPIFDPFPKTNTMPSGWDVSSLTADPATDSVAPSEDAPEA